MDFASPLSDARKTKQVETNKQARNFIVWRGRKRVMEALTEREQEAGWGGGEAAG